VSARRRRGSVAVLAAVPVLGAALVLAAGFPVAVAGPARATGGSPASGGRTGDQVVLSGDVVVPRGSRSGDVVVVHGTARIGGVVGGSVVVADGSIVVSGVVHGDVVALNGPITLVKGAHVTGDVWVTRGKLTVEVGTLVDGEIRRGSWSFLSPGTLVTKLGVWIAISVSTLLLGLLLLLLAPRGADAVGRAGRAAVGASVGWGIGLLVGLPLAVVLLLVSLVGIPFGIGLLLGLALLYSIGYVEAAWVLGRVMVHPPRHGGPRRLAAFLAGWAVLRAIGFVPVAGPVSWFLASGYGLGATAVAVWRARRTPLVAPPVAIPEPPHGGGFRPRRAPSPPPAPALEPASPGEPPPTGAPPT